MNKGFNLKTTTALILIVFLLGFGGTMIYYAFYKVVFLTVYDIDIKTVEDKYIGFNADPTLHFGKIPNTGGVSEKNMFLRNQFGIPVLVGIQVKGDAVKFIQIEDNNFVLQPGEEKNLKFYAVIPPGFNKMANFTGEAKVIYFRI